MSDSNPQVLVISSCPLSMGPAIIAGQYYEALIRKNIDADLLLKYPEEGRDDILYVWKGDPSKKLIRKIWRKIKALLFKKKLNPIGDIFFYKKECNPPVPTKDILKKIQKKYDLVLVVFWQTMLSFESIDKIYDKLHCQFQFMGVDYSPMSGGCHFIGNCEKYKTGCGCCPVFNSDDKDDFTSWNVKYRKKIYDKVKPIIYGNQYMMEFYKKSYLLKNARCEHIPCAIIDTDIFKPLVSEVSLLRQKYGISEQKKIVLFFACQNIKEERKGMSYLIETFKQLYDDLGEKSKDVIIIMAGKNSEDIRGLILFDTISLGYIGINKLPEIYSISTAFLCPSIDDAGPMMVIQSLSCGTPVVGFDMGSVKELVKNQKTGICVPLRDTAAFSEGIKKVIMMPSNDYKEMSDRCRRVALQNCSFSAQADLILNTYYKYNKMQ